MGRRGVGSGEGAVPPPQMLKIFEFCIPYLSIFRKTKRQFESILRNDIVFIFHKESYIIEWLITIANY